MATWKQMGRSANKAEIRACRYLEKNLPNEYRFFSNVSITDDKGHIWEYDIILLGLYAVYVIELKNYGGIIQGDRYLWTVLTGRSIFTPPSNNIVDTIEEKAKILKAKLSQKKSVLGRVYVHSCVCLTGRKGEIQIKDEPQRLARIHWLDDIQSYLTDRSVLPVPYALSVKIDDIRRDHQTIQQIIENRTIFKPLEKQDRIGEYQVIDVAWRANRYLALYSSHSGKWPPKSLLKVYDIPDASQEAIKNIIDSLNRELSALRMIRENEISNPQSGARNVIAAFETFLHPSGRHYVVVMEWVNGELLDTKLKSGSLTLVERLKIATQICRGLACAHRSGVVHRNLTPKNVIVDLKGIVKIINFDFAKFIPVQQSHLPTIEIGTMRGLTRFLDHHYMAPELRDKTHHDANELSDIYSTGLILAEMFFGSSPIAGQRTDLGQLPVGEPQIGELISGLVDKMCEKRVELRYKALYEAAEQFNTLADLVSMENNK